MTCEEMLEEVESYEPWFNPIDEEVAREEPCPDRGARCHFEGFQHGDSQRAFLVSSNGHCTEFKRPSDE